MCGAETWTLRKVDQKYLESFEMWSWKMMEIVWTDRAINDKVLHGVKDGRNILQTLKRREAGWIGHILLRSCPLEQVTEGNIKEMRE